MKLTEFTNSTRRLVDKHIFYDFRYGALQVPIIALCGSLEKASGVQAGILKSMVSDKNTRWKITLTGCDGSFEPERAWDCIQSEFKLMNAETKFTILNNINNQFNDETLVAKEIKKLWANVLNEKYAVTLASFITDLDQEEDETVDHTEVNKLWAATLNEQYPAPLDPHRTDVDQVEVEAEENSNHSPAPTNYNLLLTISASLLAVGSAASLCVVALTLASVITTLSMTGIVAIATTGLISGAVAGYMFFKANTGESREQLSQAPSYDTPF